MKKIANALLIALATALFGCDVGSSDTVGTTGSSAASGKLYTGNFEGSYGGTAKIVVETDGNLNGEVGSARIIGSVQPNGDFRGAVYQPGSLSGEIEGSINSAGVMSGLINVFNDNGAYDGKLSLSNANGATGSLPSKTVVATYKGNFTGLIPGSGTIRVNNDNYFSGEFSNVRIIGYIDATGRITGSMFGALDTPAMEIFGTLNSGVMSGDWNIYNHNAKNDGTFSLSKI